MDMAVYRRVSTNFSSKSTLTALRLWSFAALESEAVAVPKRTYREVLQQVGRAKPGGFEGWFPIPSGKRLHNYGLTH